jgi:hemerythrin-like domain-containing protein
MKPIEKLKAEHQVILRGIGLLEKGADQLENGREISPEYFRNAIDFIRNYADKYHHAKEEDILFVRLGKAGFPTQAGPVAVMLHEHELGRGFISALEKATEKYATGDQKAINEIVRNAHAYAELLRQHIRKEDMVLYPMAENALDEAGAEQMQTEFDKVEAEKSGIEARYLAILKQMENG